MSPTSNHLLQHVPPALLSGLIHYAKEQQLTYQHWFEGIALDVTQIDQGHGFISFQDICKVATRALQDTQCEHLGLEIGRDKGLISMGMLGFAMISSQNIVEALQTGLQYHPISGSVMDLDYDFSSNHPMLVIKERYPTGQLLRFFCDEALSSIISCLDVMLGDHQDLLEVHFSFAKPAHLDAYHAHYQCPLHFSSHMNALVFRPEIFTRNIKTASAANYSTAMRVCQMALQDMQAINQQQYAHVLSYLIEQHLPQHFDMTQAAQHFQMSERHLRRQLSTEGCSFQNLRQRVLENKAKQLLQQSLSISEVSQQLGFSELREFRRAFKRWTGLSPSLYKNQITP
ncbi:AraC family transcriptional regulator [Acinetobacter sp. A2]|uniref:AraC family transcriptional regulator n=1 Tax=Acinetobacter sp. A2 TaxID=362457 RepID=UPI003AF3BCE5